MISEGKESDMSQPQEDDWQNSWREDDGDGYGISRREGFGGGRRNSPGRRHDREAGDSVINLRVTVVADNGNLCVFHKKMANGSMKPLGIPANRISTINLSQADGKTLIITSDGTVCVSESFDEALSIYAAARPMVVQS